jgi:hypothetical protein
MRVVVIGSIVSHPRPTTRVADGPIDVVFNWCVDLLNGAAGLLGISYNAINVWIFCVIWPLITLSLSTVVVLQRRRLRRLTRIPAQLVEGH